MLWEQSRLQLYSMNVSVLSIERSEGANETSWNIPEKTPFSDGLGHGPWMSLPIELHEDGKAFFLVFFRSFQIKI